MTPLAIILILRFLEEIVQHYKIKKRDREINDKLYGRLEKKFVYKYTRAGELKVGDIIKIKDERIPADIIILSSTYI